MNDLIEVGVIAGAYGVRGEVRLKSYCAVPEDIETYAPLWTENHAREMTLSILRPIKNGFAVRIPNVATKEEADALRGVSLFAERGDLPSLPDDEYYYNDLIGLEVFDTGGVKLGTVKNVANNGADDLLEMQLKGSSATTFLPFTKAAVPTVDITARRIIADPPLGVLPETDTT